MGNRGNRTWHLLHEYAVKHALPAHAQRPLWLAYWQSRRTDRAIEKRLVEANLLLMLAGVREATRLPEDGHILDDLLSAAMARMAVYVRCYRPKKGTTFATYLYKCVRNEVSRERSELTRALSNVPRGRVLPTDDVDEADDLGQLRADAVVAADRLDAARLFGKLPPQMQHALAGVLEGLAGSEIAGQMGVTREYVRQVLNKAGRLLRAHLRAVELPEDVRTGRFEIPGRASDSGRARRDRRIRAKLRAAKAADDEDEPAFGLVGG